MIPRIDWGQFHRREEFVSPFTRGSDERPLRLTLHCEHLEELEGKELAAMGVLLDLGHLPEIEIVQTQPGDFPHIEVRTGELAEGVIPVDILQNGQSRLRAGVSLPNDWPLTAALVAGRSYADHPEARRMADQLIVAMAHRSTGADLLVTASPLLLKHREDKMVADSNPRTPTEAGQILGLFLRSRGISPIQALPVRKTFALDTFYWVLARHRLPAMWPYFSACVLSAKEGRDDLRQLGGSILRRCARAHKARDAVGIEFYQPQSWEGRDAMMYHFDYLTLLLAGALDAQARVASRVYSTGIDRPSFRKVQFRRALKKNDAEPLSKVTGAEPFQDLLTMLNELRNLIHEAALEADAVSAGSRSDGYNTLVAAPLASAGKLLDAANRLGGNAKWGLSDRRSAGVWIEPYSYATTLLTEALKAINAVAHATDVSRVVPPDARDELASRAPTDGLFDAGPTLGLLG